MGRNRSLGCLKSSNPSIWIEAEADNFSFDEAENNLQPTNV